LLRICHLFPELTALYGDRGNVIVFEKRCLWRGIPYLTDAVRLGDEVDFSQYQMVFIGGGSHGDLNRVVSRLMKERENLRASIDGGLVVLAIGSGFQLLGEYCLDSDGKKLSCLDILDCYTAIGEKRRVGPSTMEIQLDGQPCQVVGFTNHTGETFLRGVSPWGQVVKGAGNNSEEQGEGARYKNVFCSYFHGPLLPNNPKVADHLIKLALANAGHTYELHPLD